MRHRRGEPLAYLQKYALHEAWYWYRIYHTALHLDAHCRPFFTLQALISFGHSFFACALFFACAFFDEH